MHAPTSTRSSTARVSALCSMWSKSKLFSWQSSSLAVNCVLLSTLRRRLPPSVLAMLQPTRRKDPKYSPPPITLSLRKQGKPPTPCPHRSHRTDTPRLGRPPWQ
eukprot:1065036-Rhodomonas_salina.1